MRGRTTCWGAGLIRFALTTLTLGLVIVNLGCFTLESDKSTAWIDEFWNFDGPTGMDVVSVEVAFLEQPLADPYLNTEVWQSLDEMSLSVEQRALLRENGLRVGLVGGIVPPELQTLLTCDGSNPNPRRFRLHAGVPAEIALNGPFEELRLDWQLKLGSARPTEEYLAHRAELLLRITPELIAEGKVRLNFVPVIRHGDRHLWRSPDEGGGLSLDGVQAERVLEEFRWQLDLRPNEYAAIGTEFQRTGTLGARALVVSEGGNLIQRLLVMRAAPISRRMPHPEPLLRDDSSDELSSEVPLALQAHYGTAPGVSSRR